MTDRLWDFENPPPPDRPEGRAGADDTARAVPPTPPPAAATPTTRLAPAAPVAPPAAPSTVAGPQTPPRPAFGAGVVAPVAPAPSLAPTRPPRPGERLLVDAPATSPKSPKWGWKALAAFVVGGLLAGLGFGIGTWSQNQDDTQTAAPATPTSVAEIPQTAPPVVVEPPEIDSSEPAAVVATVLGPSIVQVETTGGPGSGVVFRDGLILTTNQVVEGAGSSVTVRNNAGQTFEAQVLGTDPRVDLAVLDVGADSGLPPAPLGLDSTPQVGQVAIAIGSPFQLQQTVTSGIVSALNRPVPTGQSAFTALLQTDTAINPGNSGGALADRDGQVIGIITAVPTENVGSTNFGVGFAIPIDTAARVAERIIAGDSLEAGFLGVAGQPEPGQSGVVITEITEGSGAEAAGLLVGDRVVSLNGAPVTSLVELAGLVQSSFVGDEVELQLVRDGENLTLNAILGAR